jgi:CRP-like cAMP-binding protein
LSALDSIELLLYEMNALDTMRALASSGEVIHVPAGSLVFKAGESGDCMFGVLEGTVDLSWNGDSGHESIEAGDVFGAGALVTPEHRRFGNATARTDCKLLVMNKEKFLFAVQESPMFAIELLGSIDQRLRDLKGCDRPYPR